MFNPYANRNPMQNARGIMQMLKGNPQAIMDMMGNNPNMQKVNEIIQQNGGDAKQAFFNLANQMGVDPNEILGIFK